MDIEFKFRATATHYVKTLIIDGCEYREVFEVDKFGPHPKLGDFKRIKEIPQELWLAVESIRYPNIVYAIKELESANS